MTANKVQSGSTNPKAGVAACFAKTSFAYNGTLVQPQPPFVGGPSNGGNPERSSGE